MPGGARRLCVSRGALRIAHDPEKWKPVFGKDHAQKKHSMSAFDPRTTPARPDLAASHLRGKVDAARFVDGAVHEVRDETAPLRREPSPDAPLDTEVLHGERVTVYETTEGWCWSQLERDGYVGWLPANALRPPGPPATHTVAALRTLAFPGPSIKLPPVAAFPLGSRLAVMRVDAALAVTASGYVPLRHLAPGDQLQRIERIDELRVVRGIARAERDQLAERLRAVHVLEVEVGVGAAHGLPGHEGAPCTIAGDRRRELVGGRGRELDAVKGPARRGGARGDHAGGVDLLIADAALIALLTASVSTVFPSPSAPWSLTL